MSETIYKTPERMTTTEIINEILSHPIWNGDTSSVDTLKAVALLPDEVQSLMRSNGEPLRMGLIKGYKKMFLDKEITTITN